jgi:hypothetical protein
MMRTLAAAGLSLALSLTALQGSPEVRGEAVPIAERLLARNLEARGGAARWAEVRALSIEGKFDAWSAPVPFTILRARPARYRFDHVLFGTPFTLAWDGADAWLRSEAFGAPQGAPLEEAWKRNVHEDSAFVSRLQELAAAKVPFEVAGRSDVEGVPAWTLVATPPGAPPETWYLDQASGLELKRESTTFDVFSGAIEMGMETFYMDWRDAEGLKLPFREERHFGTRYHLWIVEAVRVNPAIDDAQFVVPPSAGPEQEPTP